MIAGRKSRRLRVIMKGHRILEVSRKLGTVRQIKRELGKTVISGISKNESAFFFGESGKFIHLSARQFLLTRLGVSKLQRAVLYSVGSQNRPLAYPFPREYLKVLVDSGIRVSSAPSVLLWIFYLLGVFLKSTYAVCRMLVKCAIYLKKNENTSIEPYSVFVGLSHNNIPRPTKDGRSFDVISWYTKWRGASNVSTIFQSATPGEVATADGVKVKYSEYLLPLPKSLMALIKFGSWCLIAFLYAFGKLLTGKWWFVLLYGEAVNARLMRISKASSVGKEYLFSNSDTIYRPLWTYEAEVKQARIISYFYSTFEEFKLPEFYEANSTYWMLMNWPLYLVWDDYQERLLRESIGNLAGVEIVGPIWYSSSDIELPPIAYKSIAVFDVQPTKKSVHLGSTTMTDLGYGEASVPISFIRDIADVAKEFGFVLVHKRKRKVLKHSYRNYTDILARLEREKKLIPIDPDTSPVVVIEKCFCVLSMPFTSTAIMAQYCGKPTAFYDPAGVIQKDDKGAHGISLLSNKAELCEWVARLAEKAGQHQESDITGNEIEQIVTHKS